MSLSLGRRTALFTSSGNSKLAYARNSPVLSGVGQRFVPDGRAGLDEKETFTEKLIINRRFANGWIKMTIQQGLPGYFSKEG